MALRLPSLDDLLDNFETIWPTLNPIQMRAVVDMLRGVAQQMGLEGDAVPDTPLALAATFPRYKGFADAPHLKFLANHVADAIDFQEALLILSPPRHAKSSLVSLWTSFWALARDPTTSVLLISNETRAARKWGGRVRSLIDLYGDKYGLHLAPKQKSADDWELVSGGGMHTLGAGGSIPGKRAKLLLVDDALKEADARSPVVCDRMWDWWENTVLARIEPGTATIVIGTAWSEEDLLARIIKHSRAGTGVKFTVLRLPAIAEEDDLLGREEGEGLWLTHKGAGEEDFTQEWYERKRDSVSPHVWTTVYQGRATPKKGTLVDPDWWQFYKPSQIPDRFHQEIQTWDLALESKKAADSYQCGALLQRSDALIYVRDAFHEHCGITRVAEMARRWQTMYPRAVAKIIERKASGPAFIQTWSRKIPGLIPWPPKGQRMGSKEARLNALIPYIRGGNILLPIHEDGTRPKWVQELIEEFRQFPHGTHDDYIDSIGWGTLFMVGGLWDAEDRDLAGFLRDDSQPTPAESHADMLHALVANVGQKNMRALKAKMGLGARRTPDEIKAAAESSAVLPFQIPQLSKRVGGIRRGTW
jgi:predicted phage terminase large subunit-like protein